MRIARTLGRSTLTKRLRYISDPLLLEMRTAHLLFLLIFGPRAKKVWMQLYLMQVAYLFVQKNSKENNSLHLCMQFLDLQVQKLS